MEQLVQLVAQKANISPDVARVAVQTVLGFLKTKLPAPLASQIDGLLDGSASPDDVLKDGGDLLGGLLGKK